MAWARWSVCGATRLPTPEPTHTCRPVARWPAKGPMPDQIEAPHKSNRLWLQREAGNTRKTFYHRAAVQIGNVRAMGRNVTPSQNPSYIAKGNYLRWAEHRTPTQLCHWINEAILEGDGTKMSIDLEVTWIQIIYTPRSLRTTSFSQGRTCDNGERLCHHINKANSGETRRRGSINHVVKWTQILPPPVPPIPRIA